MPGIALDITGGDDLVDLKARNRQLQQCNNQLLQRLDRILGTRWFGPPSRYATGYEEEAGSLAQSQLAAKVVLSRRQANSCRGRVQLLLHITWSSRPALSLPGDQLGVFRVTLV